DGRWRGRAGVAVFAGLGAVAGGSAVDVSDRSCAALLAHGERTALRGFLESEPAGRGSLRFRALGECAGTFRVQLPPSRDVQAGGAIEVVGQWVAFEAET